MKKFLAMGEGREQVQEAFPQLILTEDCKDHSLYAEPSEKTGVPTFARSIYYDVVGVYGDDWLIIMLDDGTVGYTSQAHYWPGNG